jgi:GlpG protein
MRQLATLPSAEAAQTLADYLLTLHITTKLETQPDGCALWVCDEDQLPRARQELEEFTRNPDDPRYASAPGTAGAIRRRQVLEEAAYHRRQQRFNRRMGGPLDSMRWTVGLVVACCLLSLLSDGGHARGIVQALSITTYRWTEEGLVATGGDPVLNGQVWRLVTPIFLHFGIWHLVFNMFMLYDLGGLIERRRGALRYLALVLVLAVVSNLVQYYLGHPVREGSELKFYHVPNFGGMSGVVYGLFGYIWMKARFAPELGLRIHPSNVVYLMAWFFLCMTGWVGPIANGAHIGGLLAGMLIGYLPTLWRSSHSG